MASTPGVFSVQQFTDIGGPLVGGRLYTYTYGTTSHKVAYTDLNGTIAHTYTSDGVGGQYIALDARGELPAPLYLVSGSYDLALKRSDGSTVWTRRADPVSDAFLAQTGAGLVGFLYALAYPVGSVGKWLKDLALAAGSSFIGFVAAAAGAVTRTMQAKGRESVSVLDYGADPTGVALCNAAFDAAKLDCKTLHLPPGIYRLENYTTQDVRLIGVRCSGANNGANEQTIIEGSGDLLVGANNFSMEHLVIRNSVGGTRGKLVTVANIDTKIGPFIDVEFRKATYHIYQGDVSKTIVDGLFRDCRFSDANTYSRCYTGGLFRYAEENCYSQSNKRALLVSSTSAAEIGGVFELQEEGAVYVTNTVTATDTVRSLKFKNAHFELNGNVTPTADVTINITLSLARIEFDSCGFYLPTVANVVDLASSPFVRLVHHNCTDISFDGVVAGTVITELAAKRSGETNGLRVFNGAIRATGGALISDSGFLAASGLSYTITGSATPTVAMPAAGASQLVLVADSTTAGQALLVLNNGVVTSISTTLTSITWSVVAGVLNGNTTGGASSRVLFFNFIST